MMDTRDLDAVLTEWGRQAREAAGPEPTPRLPQRTRRPRHFGWQLTAGVAAIAVAATVAVGLPRLLAKDSTADPLRGITSTASAPAGFQVVTFHGLSITVPASWQVSPGMPCPVSRNVVVLPAVSALCLPIKIAIVEFGGLQPISANSVTSSRQVSIDGVPAVRLTGVEGRPAVAYVFASLQASVLIFPTASQSADGLAATLRVNAVDVHGCASRISNPKSFPPAIKSTRPGTAGTLIPGDPDELLSCRYMDGWLEQGSTLSGAALRRFISTVNGLPPGLSRVAKGTNLGFYCPGSPHSSYDNPASYGESYRFGLRYPDGPPLQLVARLSWCGNLGISNGSRTGQRTDALTRLLSDTVGSSNFMPEQVTPAP